MGAFTSALLDTATGQKKQKFSHTRPPPPKSYPEYVSSPVEEHHREFMKSVCVLLLQHGLFWQKRRKEPPIRFRKPEQLYQLLDYELRDTGTNQFDLLALLRKILYYSPTFAHPYYMYQLLAGLDPYAVVGDFVASIVPSTMLAYRDAPVYSLMEEEVSKRLRQLVGYPEGTGDCMFPPGCAIANTFAILLARHKRFPESKQKGIMHLPPLVIFVTQDMHNCFQKGSIYTSIGLENVCLVKTDSKGKMNIQHLIKCIEETVKAGKVPLMVGATSGTNVFGAFDSLEEISKVCKQFDMWLHSDGALGGGVIFSPTQRALRLKGIELCDSFAGNFHKIGSATQVSSFLITPHTTIFSDAFGLGHRCEDYSSYETTPDYFCSELDTYEKYIDHSRRPDIVKLFMMWKGKGLQGLAANIDDAYERAKFFLEELKRRQKHNGKFVPLMDEFESPVIPFYYVPIYLHSLDRTAAEFKERLNMHTSFLLAELIKNGVMVITAQSLRQSPLFFKVVLHNSSLTNKDIVYLLDQLDNYGSYLRVPFEVPTYQYQNQSIAHINRSTTDLQRLHH